MSDLNGVNTNIDWIKESLTRIEKHINEQDVECSRRRSDIYKEIKEVRGLSYKLIIGGQSLLAILVLALKYLG